MVVTLDDLRLFLTLACLSFLVLRVTVLSLGAPAKALALKVATLAPMVTDVSFLYPLKAFPRTLFTLYVLAPNLTVAGTARDFLVLAALETTKDAVLVPVIL